MTWLWNSHSLSTERDLPETICGWDCDATGGYYIFSRRRIGTLTVWGRGRMVHFVGYRLGESVCFRYPQSPLCVGCLFFGRFAALDQHLVRFYGIWRQEIGLFSNYIEKFNMVLSWDRWEFIRAAFRLCARTHVLKMFMSRHELVSFWLFIYYNVPIHRFSAFIIIKRYKNRGNMTIIKIKTCGSMF